MDVGASRAVEKWTCAHVLANAHVRLRANRDDTSSPSLVGAMLKDSCVSTVRVCHLEAETRTHTPHLEAICESGYVSPW